MLCEILGYTWGSVWGQNSFKYIENITRERGIGRD